MEKNDDILEKAIFSNALKVKVDSRHIGIYSDFQRKNPSKCDIIKMSDKWLNCGVDGCEQRKITPCNFINI